MGGDRKTPGWVHGTGWVDGTDGGRPAPKPWIGQGVLRGHTDMLRAVAWSPCGRKELNSMKQQLATVDGSEIRG